MQKINYLIDMENVLAAVENGRINLGIIPVVNLQGGLVKMALDAMGRHNFEVIDELWLDVNQCLLAKPGTTVKDIKKIVSHVQPLKQCKNYLEKNFNTIELIEYIDTAKAARDLSDNKLPESSAVIAPEHSAKLYGLEVLVRNIQDIKPNLTAFIIVKKRGDV
jgi:prephenate dehydratase